MQLECDVFLTHVQAGRDVPEESSTGDLFLTERKLLPIELVVSVTLTARPYRFWYKKCGQWERASREVCHIVAYTSTIKSLTLHVTTLLFAGRR